MYKLETFKTNYDEYLVWGVIELEKEHPPSLTQDIVNIFKRELPPARPEIYHGISKVNNASLIILDDYLVRISYPVQDGDYLYMRVLTTNKDITHIDPLAIYALKTILLKACDEVLKKSNCQEIIDSSAN